MATKSGETYLPVDRKGDDDEHEPFNDEVNEMETGRVTTKVPKIPKQRHEAMEMSPMEVSESSQGDKENDFWACCLAQGFFGLVGSLVVYCCNSHRRNYPTPEAWNGCMTGFVVVFILYLLLVGLGSAAGNY